MAYGISDAFQVSSRDKCKSSFMTF